MKLSEQDRRRKYLAKCKCIPLAIHTVNEHEVMTALDNIKSRHADVTSAAIKAAIVFYSKSMEGK